MLGRIIVGVVLGVFGFLAIRRIGGDPVLALVIGALPVAAAALNVLTSLVFTLVGLTAAVVFIAIALGLGDNLGEGLQRLVTIARDFASPPPASPPPP